MQSKSIPAILLTIGMYGACRSGEVARSPNIHHPTSANLTSESNEPLRVVADSQKVPNADFASLVERLQHLSKIREVGASDGDPNYVFGAVASMAQDSNGRLLVLDARLNELRAFDADGKYLLRYGSSASGPQQMRAPFAVEVIDRNRVVILDRGRLIRPVNISGTQWFAEDTVTSPVAPDAICAIGDELIVRGWSKSGVAHVIRDGIAVKSFARPYQDADSAVSAQLSEGIMGCSQTGTVVQAFSYLPILKGYTKDGAIKWSLRFESFKTIEINSSEKPRLRVTYDMASPFDVPASLVSLGDGYFLYQIARRVHANGVARMLAVRSYLISEKGDAQFITSDLPVIAAARLPMLYGIANDPSPRITYFTLPKAAHVATK